MPKFSASCSDIVALARANFSCPCVKLGCCTPDIERAVSGAARAPLCRLTVSCGFTSVKTRTATCPCPSRTRHHCNRRPHCRHRRSEDGRAHTIHLFVFNQCVSMFSRLHAPTVICPCGKYQKGTSASLSPHGKLRIYFRQNANGPSLVWYVCLSPRHARAHRGHDIIATVSLIAAIVRVAAGTDSRK